MVVLSRFLFVLALGMSLTNAYAVGTELFSSDELQSPLRRLDFLVSDGQYDRFEKARQRIFGEFLQPSDVDEQNFLLFELVFPHQTKRTFILGSPHDLPYEILPVWAQRLIEGSEEVYVENDLFLKWRSPRISSPQELNFTDSEWEALSSICSPLFEVFSESVKDASLESLFSVMGIFGYFMGLDTSIAWKALQLNKPVFLLDPSLDVLEGCMFRAKKRLQKEQGGELPVDLEDRGKIMAYCIRKRLASLQEELSHLAETLKSVKEDWYEDLRQIKIEDPTFLIENTYGDEAVEVQCAPRNERWARLLSVPSTAQRFICVGASHLPGLFQMLKASGVEIKTHTNVS